MARYAKIVADSIDLIGGGSLGTVMTEAIQDMLSTFFVDSTSIDFTYNDVSNTMTAAVVTEAIQDIVNGLLVAGTGITLTYDDTANTLTIASSITQYTDEQAQDAIGSILVDGGGIDWTYNDATPSITAAISAELQAIAALTPSNDDFIQRKAGAWANRTIAQVITDLTEGIQDMLSTFLVAGTGMTLTYDDVANTLTFASSGGYTDEQAQDAIGSILVDSTTIDFTYSDATPSITATFNPTADVAFNSHKATGVADPTAAQDAATKNYVDTKPGLFAGVGANYTTLTNTTDTSPLGTYHDWGSETVDFTGLSGVPVTVVAILTGTADDLSGGATNKNWLERTSISLDGGSSYTAGDDSPIVTVNDATHGGRDTTVIFQLRSGTPTGTIKVKAQQNHTAGGSVGDISASNGHLMAFVFRT